MSRVFLAGFLWVLAVAPLETAAASDRLVLSYALWKGGFHALDLKAGLSRGGDDYTVRFAAHTRGFIGWLYPYLLEGEAAGTLAGKGPRPDRFATLARSRSDEKRRAISYLDDGTLVTWSEPPRSAADDEAAVPVAMRRNTLDPASAILSVVETVARAGRCQGAYPVYDGRRRYDLSVSLVGPRSLAPSSYSSYSGPATLCRVEVNRLAGFHDDDDDDDEGLPTVINVWLASVANSEAAIPVRLEGESDLGSLIIHLVDASVEADPEGIPESRSAAR